MAELTNPDLELLRWVNGLGAALPGWARDGVAVLGEVGLPLLTALVCVAAWRSVCTRPGADAARAGVLWAPVAALVAFAVNVPIRELVARPHPIADHGDLAVLLAGRTGFSFVSDHATAAMAVAVALLLVHRRLGLAALVLALAQGVVRVLAGVHYPTDVVGGYALGAAVALLLSPLALWVLTPLVRALSRRGGSGGPGAPRPRDGRAVEVRSSAVSHAEFGFAGPGGGAR